MISTANHLSELALTLGNSFAHLLFTLIVGLFELLVLAFILKIKAQ